MTREEMVIKLTKHYAIRHVMVEGGYLTPMEFMDEILANLEASGMLAPSRPVKSVMPGIADFMVNEWEVKDKPSYHEMAKMMSEMDEAGFAFDNPNEQNALAMPEESVTNLLEEVTAEELLKQGICPCGATSSVGCSVTGCALYCYEETCRLQKALRAGGILLDAEQLETAKTLIGDSNE
jgi:hypothetical protein